jgi:RNA polymerase sigma factor (sigma-70 family)
VAAVPSIGRATGVEAPAAADAAHDLYVRNYPRVLRFCRSRLRSREDAEDAAQTTFAYAVGALRRGVVPALESAWLLKIARNVCLNRWAAGSRRSAVEVARDPQLLQELAEGHEPTVGEAHALYEALQRLTEQQRRAIVLREWQGLSYAEIAEELELSQSAVETLIFRARRALTRELRRDDQLRPRSALGSLLAGLKSLLGSGGAGVKVAAGIAALATAGGIAAPKIEHLLQHHKPAPVVSTPNVARATVVPSAARQGVSDHPARTSAAPKARRLVSSPITADSPTRAGLPQRDAPSGHTPGSGSGATSPPPDGTPAKPDEPSQSPPSSSPPPPGETDPPVSLPAPTLPPPPALPPAPTVPPTPALPPPPDLPATPPAPALPPTPTLPPVNPPDPPLPGGGVNLP